MLKKQCIIYIINNECQQIKIYSLILFLRRTCEYSLLRYVSIYIADRNNLICAFKKKCDEYLSCTCIGFLRISC